tara:strand:+ start:53 stop:259 length:207 start_codon:yes stop_codon:yes gene_type:complete
MSYTTQNFKTKKALREAVARGEPVSIYNPGLGTPVDNGKTTLEGPHYPAPHTWYAEVVMKDRLVVKVK